MKISISKSLTSNKGVGGATYDPAAAALFARFTTPPTDARKALINSVFASLRAAGLLATQDLMWMAGANAQATQRNWIQDDYNLTPINSPPHTADRGYAGDGSSAYLATGLNPSSSPGLNATLNNVCLWAWSKKVAADHGGLAGQTVETAPTTALFGRYTDNKSYCGLNSAEAAGPTNADGSGLWLISRSASGALSLYRNGALVSSPVTASSSIRNGVLNFLRAQNFFGNTLVAGGFGGAMDATQAAAHYAATLTYLQAIGAV